MLNAMLAINNLILLLGYEETDYEAIFGICIIINKNLHCSIIIVIILTMWKGGLSQSSEIGFFFFCTCHNFFPLSSVQIIIIPACCLLCVL